MGTVSAVPGITRHFRNASVTAIGVQFVDVPEFADMATKVSSYVDDVLTGASSVQSALDKGQKDAEAVTKVYQKK
jgi:polyol transport system substrate-binding protein